MITEQITLVLGAGAGVPYGFPTGTALFKDIYNNFGLGDYKSYCIEKSIIKPPEDLFDAFKKSLYFSGHLSIDAFLEHHPEFHTIGRLAIAHCLILCEISVNIYSLEKIESHWYRYLFSKLNAKYDAFGDNNLSIITFNYDRSIEFFLFNALKHLSSNKPDKEIAEKLNCIPIIHVHGKLGNLPWQEGNSREFSAKRDPRKVAIASKDIKILSETDKKTKEFEDAFEILQNSKQIFFLGFGYNNTSLERLGMREINKTKGKAISAKKIIGTAYGMGRAEAIMLKNQWHIETYGDIDDVYSFLKNHVLVW